MERKLYVPSGWWLRGDQCQWFCRPCENGDVLKSLPSNNQPHKHDRQSRRPSGSSAASETTFSRLAHERRHRGEDVSPIGEKGVFPFTVNHTNTLRSSASAARGVDIANLETGKIFHRIMAKGDDGQEYPSHARMRPHAGRNRIVLSDQAGNRLYVFDATQMPPVQKGHVDLSAGGHGWVTFSLDGRFAWCHTPM